jgi:Carboxypeptidase regulatory-like domain
MTRARGLLGLPGLLGLVLSLGPTAPRAFAQAPTAGTLRVTVVDQTGAVIVGATVTVAGTESATSAATPAPVQTSDMGVATVSGLAPGRYTVHAEFPGFESQLLKDVRVRAGENKQVAVLPLPKLEASITVAQDKQEAAADRAQTFGTALTRDEIEALSDDPATLQQQLQDMAGPGAIIRIDGFEGGALPAKAQIRSIRISRDQFAAEYHSAGGVFIEIITQPGLGPIRYNSTIRVRDGSLSGRSPFVPVKGPEQNAIYGLGLGGALIKDKSSFYLSAYGVNSYDTPNLNAALPNGTQALALGLKTPRDNLYVNGQMDYALTLDQTLRFAYNLTRVTNNNLGVGGYDEAERAYSTESNVNNVRIQHFGPLGRRAVLRTRLQLFWSDTDTQSATQAPTIRVLDAFTSGGAQLSGGDHARTLDLGSDLDYVLGKHSLRAGILLNGGWYHSNTSSNYLGTYTFDNLQAFEANQPSNYSRRLGDPEIAYQNLQGGIYVQDDIRVRKNLTLSPGVRYEVQTHVHDYNNVGPRFGVTWAPSASGQTTLRGSAGIFYDWLPTSTYDQALRVDGVRQQEVNIVDPSFPDPGSLAPGLGNVPPANRYLLGSDYRAPQTTRFSAGIEQGLVKVVRVVATYSYQRGSDLSRGLNLNPPVNGVRPDPEFANIIEVVSDAASRQHQLQVDANVNPGALLPAFNGPRINWKRTTMFINYTLATLRNNTDGPFSIPATGDLAAEWGPAATDVRHRLNVTFNNQVIRNVLMSLNVNTSTGPAYTLLTGRDDNGDGVFNDRPAGVGRNTLRASGQTTVYASLAYQFAIGHTAPLPPGIGVFGGGGAAQVRTFDQGNARYRLQVFVQAQNLTNQANYLGYSGTMTSPFFGRPTSVSGMRKIDAGISLNF